MTSESQVWLHSASVVILAEYHNPSILNKGFLVMNGIVPSAWSVAETVVSPITSVVGYANGIRLQVDGQRMEITEKCDFPFSKYVDDRLYNLAISYVNVLPHVPYRGLGINYAVSVIRQDPPQWITKRFLKFDSWDKEFYMMPRFSISVGDAILNLSMYSKTTLREGNSQSSVVVDCNLHYGEQLNATSLCEKIRGWTKGKEHIVEALGKVLGD